MSSKLQSDGCYYCQWWRRLVNAYGVKAGMVCLQYKNCAIRTRSLHMLASHDGVLYESTLPLCYMSLCVCSWRWRKSRRWAEAAAVCRRGQRWRRRPHSVWAAASWVNGHLLHGAGRNRSSNASSRITARNSTTSTPRWSETRWNGKRLERTLPGCVCQLCLLYCLIIYGDYSDWHRRPALMGLILPLKACYCILLFSILYFIIFLGK